MPNQEHIDLWVEDLRTTDAPQATGRLGFITSPGRAAYCCVGRACVVADVPRSQDFLDQDLQGRTLLAFGAHSDVTVAPRELIEWLGFAQPGSNHQLMVDWPEGLRTQGIQRAGEPSAYGGGERYTMTCTELNDNLGLTFPQIADVVAYFGLREY